MRVDPRWFAVLLLAWIGCARSHLRDELRSGEWEIIQLWSGELPDVFRATRIAFAPDGTLFAAHLASDEGGAPVVAFSRIDPDGALATQVPLLADEVRMLDLTVDPEGRPVLAAIPNDGALVLHGDGAGGWTHRALEGDPSEPPPRGIRLGWIGGELHALLFNVFGARPALVGIEPDGTRVVSRPAEGWSRCEVLGTWPATPFSALPFVCQPVISDSEDVLRVEDALAPGRDGIVVYSGSFEGCRSFVDGARPCVAGWDGDRLAVACSDEVGTPLEVAHAPARVTTVACPAPASLPDGTLAIAYADADGMGLRAVVRDVEGRWTMEDIVDEAPNNLAAAVAPDGTLWLTWAGCVDGECGAFAARRR